MKDDPLATCPECSGAIKRLLYPVGIVFKGSGWYINDSRKPEKSESDGEKSEAKKDDKSTGDKIEKSDSSATSEKSEKTDTGSKNESGSTNESSSKSEKSEKSDTPAAKSS